MKVPAVTRNASVPGQDAPEATTGNSHWIGTGTAAPERANTAPVHLTPRQIEVLRLLCEGLPNKLICRRLNISTGTVKVHISGILRVFGVTSRLQAVVAARQCGLLSDAAVADDSVPVEHAVAGGMLHQISAGA